MKHFKYSAKKWTNLINFLKERLQYKTTCYFFSNKHLFLYLFFLKIYNTKNSIQIYQFKNYRRQYWLLLYFYSSMMSLLGCQALVFQLFEHILKKSLIKLRLLSLIFSQNSDMIITFIQINHIKHLKVQVINRILHYLKIDRISL